MMTNQCIPPPPSPFCVVAWNARHVKGKLGEVEQFLDNYKPSILIISEAHLLPDFQLPDFYPYIHEYKSYEMANDKHDGLLIYIHPSISYKFIDIPYRAPSPSKTILSWIRCSSPVLPQPMLVGAAYMDPYSDRFGDHDKQFILGSINAASTYDIPILILGDLNARHPSWSPAQNVHGTPTRANTQGSFLKTLLDDQCDMLDTSLTLINTHFSPSGNLAIPTHPIYDSVIDLALTSDVNIVAGFDVLQFNTWLTSDHHPISVTLESLISAPPVSDNRHRTWSLKHADWDMFQLLLNSQLPAWTTTATNLLENGECTDIISYQSPLASSQQLSSNQSMINTMWSSLHNIIISAANSSVGKHCVSRTSKPWYTIDPAIPQLNRDYRRAYKAFLRHRKNDTLDSNPHIIDVYKQTKKDFRDAAFKAKDQCWRRIADKIDDKHKIVWASFKLTNPSSLPPLASFTTPTCPNPSSPQQSLDNLASHFAAVSNIPNDPSFDPTMDTIVNNYINDSIPPLSANDNRVDLPFSLPDLARQCEYVDIHTSIGPDDLSPSFLRNGGEKLHAALYLFFLLCYNFGVLPNDFVSANVVALYKQSGDKSVGSNYRPISITSIVMRVFENLMLPSLKAIMAVANIPSHHQFGFTDNRSTHDALYTFLSEISHNVDSAFVPAVFIDIQKAYDRVWVKGLIYKLHKIGVRGHLFHFYHSLVSNRSFSVLHSGLKSYMCHTTDGVPQGCVSSPLLFNIYIHNICDNIHDLTRLNLFADDILVYPRSTTHSQASIPHMQYTLDSISAYASKWKILFSNTKSNYMLFTNKRSAIPPHSLILANSPLTLVDEYRYLGILLDSRLSFKPHLTSLLKPLNHTSMLICRLIPSKGHQGPTFPVINRLVQALLIPKLTYCLPFINITNTKYQQIFIKIKKYILTPLRRSLGLPAKASAHHDSIFIESRILNLSYLQAHSALSYAHRLLSIHRSQQQNPHQLHHHTANQFHNHLNLYSLLDQNPTCHHPMSNILFHMKSYPSLSTPDKLLGVDRRDLRLHLFQLFYTQWYNVSSLKHHSLYIYYDMNPPSSLALPSYLLIDPCTTATIRSRMRFGRTLLNHYRHRIGYKDTLQDGSRIITSSLCSICQTPETISHVVCDCPVYEASRFTCLSALSLYNIPLSEHLILSSPSYPSIPRHAHAYIHRVLSDFLTSIQRVRKC